MPLFEELLSRERADRFADRRRGGALLVAQPFRLDGYPATRHGHVCTGCGGDAAVIAISAESLGSIPGECSVLCFAVKDEGFEAFVAQVEKGCFEIG